MLYYIILQVLLVVENNPDGCLMINDFAIVIELYIVSAIEAPVPENIVNLQALIGWLQILFGNRHFFGCFNPWLFLRSTLLPYNLLDLELIIIKSVLGSVFDLCYILLIFSIMSHNFIPNVRIYQVIYILLEVHLSFCDKTHVEHPFLVILIFEAHFGKLLFINDLILVEIVFFKLIFV